jgi:hypothetical protein
MQANSGAAARRKGLDAERAVARYLREKGFPEAFTARSASGGMQEGPDILGVPGVSLEVKSRKALDIGAALHQASSQAHLFSLPVVLVKPYGIGLDSVGDWWAISYVRDIVPTWRHTCER